MKYQREIHFTLHDYKTKKQDQKWMSRFLAIHKRMATRYYIDTLRHLIYTYEKLGHKHDWKLDSEMYYELGKCQVQEQHWIICECGEKREIEEID